MRYKIIWPLKWHLLFHILSSCDAVFGQIRYSIPEELQHGAFVGNLAADLGFDVNQLRSRRLRIVVGTKEQYLEVNLESGILFVNRKIDRELLCGSILSCVLSLEAVIQNPLNLFHVEVEILDVNDNAPKFPKDKLHLEISEVAAPGARFPVESAFDPDVGSNSVQSYGLLPNDYFTLDVETRRGLGIFPVLVLESSLDREKQSIHRLVLTAKDSGSPERSGTAEITVEVQDANDNLPVFLQTSYKVSLLENAPKGTLVIHVNATDLDAGTNGEIEFSFSSQTTVKVFQLFSIDSKTGEITVEGSLDYEDNNVYAINVQAVDKGSAAVPVYCDVLVDITDENDNTPEVTLTSLSSPVSEHAPSGTVVALISAADKDSGENGQVKCEIGPDLPFRLESSLKHYYRLVTRRQLDRESVFKYDVIITCSDAGSPPLSSNKTILVEVSDVNDNSPRFPQSSYNAYIMENNIIGNSFFQVTAVDTDVNQNALLTYSIAETYIQGELATSFVQINSENGIIHSQRSFDYEELKNFQVQIQVLDSGVPQLSSKASVDVIIVDQNDNAPVIVHPMSVFGSTVTETVPRFAEPGYMVAKVSATDADSGQNAQLSYEISQGTAPDLFTISAYTGDIWTIRRIENQDGKSQRLLILVKDSGTPSLTATMTIALSVTERETELNSGTSSLSENRDLTSDLSLYLVISLGIISSIFFVVLIILASKVQRQRLRFADTGCYVGICCCFEARNSLNGIQKASRNIHLAPNYVDVFGGDPLSQSFRYEACSTLNSTKRTILVPKPSIQSTGENYMESEAMEIEKSILNAKYSNKSSTVNDEVKQPNADWHFSQTHRAELNSAQYLEEEGARREIQCEVQREVHRDVQREALRDEPCEVPRNIQRDVPRDPHCDGQRDPHCNGQRAAENDPGGPRKPMCARPPAIPAGRDGWTLPRTAPRMQLQMTLGTHVPGTLRSQYLFPRDPLTPGARISNSSVEFSAFPVGSHHGPWAANQTRDRGSVTDSGTRRPELDTETGGEIHRSPPSSRLPTQRLHSRDHNHALRQIND
ncbi:protocadherin gamma-A6-like isoform X3 [Rhinoraja longicauda]